LDTEDDLKDCRPDYLVVVDKKIKNVIGEVKPTHGSLAGEQWDLLRLGLFGRKRLDSFPIRNVVCFQVKGFQIVFYLITKTKDIYFLTEVESVTFPVSFDQFNILPSQLNSLYNISFLYEQYCQTASSTLSPFRPFFHSFRPSIPFP
jgi:hypothetical protein